jgi:tetratricopeptide (TPR) repeat protein
MTLQYKDYINLGREEAPARVEAKTAEAEEVVKPCVELTTGVNDRGVRVVNAAASLLPGSDGNVKLFARNLERGRLEKETLFSSGYANYMLGKNFADLGALDRATEVFGRAQDQFEQLIRRYPGHDEVARATFYLGNIQFVQGNYHEAISYYREVIEKSPKSDFIPQTRLRMGMAYEKLGKIDDAIEQYAYLAFHHKDSPYVKDSMVNMVLYFDKLGTKANAEGDKEARDGSFSRLVSVAKRFVEKFPEDERAPKLILRAALRMIALARYEGAAELLEKAETTHATSDCMPAFLYWHAEALVKGNVGEEPSERACVLLKRIIYDFAGNDQYVRAAKARLIEIEK